MSAKKDQQLLAEAYQEIQEGLWDRLKARGSQAVGAAKGLGGRVKGAAKDIAGQAVGAAGKGIQSAGEAIWADAPKENKLLKKAEKLKQAGAADTAAGKASGQEAKYTSYINNSAKTIVNDLKKLGMALSVPEEELTQQLVDIISNSLENVQSERLTGPREFAKDAPSEARYKDSEGKVGGQVARTGGQ